MNQFEIELLHVLQQIRNEIQQNTKMMQSMLEVQELCMNNIVGAIRGEK